MPVPSRLVYDDGTGQTVIGTFLPQDQFDGGINTFTLDAEARNYKRTIIEGESQLASNMPVLKSEFGTSEPEIIVQVDENNDGSWTDRMRVYPEGGGSTLDNGRYKHEELWGFKKYYGEDKVDIGPITGTIVDVVEETLPTGYTVQYPNDETPPNVYEFSANDARQQIWTDIQEDFGHFIEFTEDTDGSGDVIVELQPVGYGGTQFSLTRGQDLIDYDYWKFNDTSQIVSEVRVVGTTTNGDTINITRTPSDFSSIAAAERDRFRPIKAGYLGGNTTEATEMAEEIAKRNLQPEPSENGALTTNIRDASESNLNQSVGILDEQRGAGIDNVFTVVKQKDFLHEGTSYLSFEFESESTQEQRSKWREHDDERARIYPEGQQDVGGQTIDQSQSNTTTAQSDISTSEDDQSPDVDGDSNFDNAAGQYNFEETGATVTNQNTVSVTVTTGTFGTQIFLACLNVSFNGTAGDIEITIQNDDTFVTYFNETITLVQNTTSRTITIMQSDPIDGDDISAEVTNATGSTAEISLDLTVDQIEAHRHGEGDYNAVSHNHNVDANDAGHGDTTDPSTHELQGQTETGQNINTATEDKTDR